MDKRSKIAITLAILLVICVCGFLLIVINYLTQNEVSIFGIGTPVEIIEDFDMPEEYDHTATEQPVEVVPEFELTGIDYRLEGGLFELPINGASGWAASNLPVHYPEFDSDILLTLSPGDGFTIILESESHWYIELLGGQTGWVDYRGAFINLPDILPSIRYRNAAASEEGSIMRSLTLSIPGVTGEVLSDAYDFNERFNRDMYIFPAMYSLAKSLAEVQFHAIDANRSLIIYESFRTAQMQRAVVEGMNALIRSDERVRNAITTSPWSLTWFISTGISNHQRGAAVDAMIGNIIRYGQSQVGDYIFMNILFLDDLDRHMPSPIHELSPRAAIVSSPRDITAQHLINGNIAMTERVTSVVRDLQRYFGLGGFTGLSSEWWHFNHPPSVSEANAKGITGDFIISSTQSRPPVKE